MGRGEKRGRAFLLKRLWSCDSCHTLKSCAGVVFITTAVAAMLLIIRLVGEKKLQRILNFILLFKRREPELNLVSEALVNHNRS